MRWLIVAAALAACGREPHEIVLWHSYSGSERAALETTAARWNAAHPEAPLELVATPHDGFADKLSSAIPRGNGPDLFIYAQDRIGDWADAGVLEPLEFWVDDHRADRFTDDSLEAMTYKGSLFGMPIAVKSLALFYRTDLAPKPPRTTGELAELAKVMKAKNGYALAYANVDLYGHAAWLHGFGGKVMDDDGHLAIATPEAAAAMKFARELITSGTTPQDMQNPQVASMFNDGRAATVMMGPWFMEQIDASVPWKVAPIPAVDATGKPAAPFASAEGVMMSGRAHDKDIAFAAIDFISDDTAAIERAKMTREVVPNVRAWDDPDIAKDDVLAAERAQMLHVVSIPKVPAMRTVWIPYATALGEVLAGRADASEKLLDVERQVQGYADHR